MSNSFKNVDYLLHNIPHIIMIMMFSLSFQAYLIRKCYAVKLYIYIYYSRVFYHADCRKNGILKLTKAINHLNYDFLSSVIKSFNSFENSGIYS